MNIRITLTFAVLLPTIAFSEDKELEGERAAAKSDCPSPGEAARKMTVPAGYGVRCFAHEPMVVNPVAMTWDTRGRLWVVEGYEYPEGSPHKKEAFGGEAGDDQYHPVPEACRARDNPLDAMRADHPNIPRDRIVILEDADNDGVADKRTVFLEGLDMGSAILPGDGGVYVGQQPHLLHFKDTDGDDHADEWRVVLTGFGREDTHELLNSFCWGPDGWLYLTHGVFTHSRVRRPGEPVEKGIKFDAGIGRCRPAPGSAGVSPAPFVFEVFADGTSNPWGCDYDARGNLFVSACVIDHFFHMAPGGLYQRQGGAPENPYAYELLPSIVAHKHFRAAYAGVQIYQAGVYPRDTWGHAFIGNIHDNAVHEEVLTPAGSTFQCEPRRDFLRANDGWFRPVSTQTGPDGNLWIMDWCDKYPCYQNAKANPEGVDREKGRIWRVVWTGNTAVPAVGVAGVSPSTQQTFLGETPKTPTGATPVLPSRESREMDLSKLSTDALVKMLGHSNSWMRRMARRLIVEHATPKLQDELERLASDTKNSPEARVEAFWTLCSLPEIHPQKKDTGLLKAFASDLPAIRAAMGRLASQNGGWDIVLNGSKVEGKVAFKPHLIESLARLGSDQDSGVRGAALAFFRRALGQRLTTDRNTPMVAREPDRGEQPAWMDVTGEFEELAKANMGESDPGIQFAIWMLLEPMMAQEPKAYVEALSRIAPASQPLSHVLAYKSMRRLCDTRDAKNLDLAVAFCEKIQSDDVLLARALEGLVRGQEAGVIEPSIDASNQLTAWRGNKNADVRHHAEQLAVLWGDEAATEALVKVMSSEKDDPQPRLQALQILRKVKSDAVRQALVALLARSDDTPVGTPAKPTTGVSSFLVEAIRTAADFGGNEFVAPLTKLAASKDYGVRLAALEALSGRAAWTHPMLDGIASNKISAAEFPASVRRQLAISKDKSIRDHASKVLGVWKESSADTKTLVAAKKKACLEGEPDLAAGKVAFTTTCAVCHTFHGGGQKVGPDLIGSGRSNLDALLANVIDPNQIIGNGYENINVTTKDGRIVAGRMVEDTPSHVKLLAIAGAEQIVPRDQIASLANTHQSVMPVGFGALPDDVFRNLVWYVLAPPEEGPLTKEKRELLSQGVEGKSTAGSKSRVIDWESISLWNPQWKVEAPEFERTPVKLAEFHGRTNVLLMHPFMKDKPCALERKATIGSDKLNRVSFFAAAHDQGDWELRVKVDGEVVKQETIGHEGERWRHIEVDLARYAGKEVTLRLEGAANGWSNEFGYWSDVKLE